MGGYCGDGWHKEGGKCVRDPESVKEEAKQAPASKGLDLTNPVAAPPEPQQPDPQQPLDLASHDETRDTGNLVTGNVVGVGRSSWAWLLVLIGVVTIGLSYYAYKKR
jgi:hypothetical protein